MKLFCENCGTQIFETDRNCPSCGGSIQNLFTIKKEIQWIEPKITCVGYNKNDEIIFKGICIADYKIKTEPVNSKDGKTIFYHSQQPDLNIKITNIEWEKEEKINENVIKTVLNIEIIKENTTKNIQMIIPHSKVIGFNNDEINISGLYYMSENSNESICFYYKDVE